MKRNFTRKDFISLFTLGGTALLIAALVSIPLGVIAARRPDSATDGMISAIALTLFSAPTFWLAQLAILFFALGLRVLPVQGMTTAGSDAGGVRYFIDVVRHLALPAVALAAQELAVFVRLTRSGLIDELARDHIRTARAKGVSDLSDAGRDLGTRCSHSWIPAAASL